MQISLIVAVAENGVIGANGKLPWKLSSDLKTFRRITMGKPVIMGRKTFQSLKGPLDGRDNIVLTRDPHFEAPSVSTVDSFADALTLARTLAATRGADEIMVIGGADVFRAALPHATRLYWTVVHARPEGDVHFPYLDLSSWTAVESAELPASEKDNVTATFKVLDRK
ncbi:dihydrofolate reductase [Hyphomicrobium sp.]|uniref:dihydrofolate reductase n=1 Tax=Hyphomicrobium sp. TaxID=82 RepID=UPI002E3582B2|nr:dihydrofolate reductase [Hyphomicrobium sp.]HEX2840229.1 dihydrofolate reductase [Hyphomicrobium sp.]